MPSGQCAHEAKSSGDRRLAEHVDSMRRRLFHEGPRCGVWGCDSSACDAQEPDEVVLQPCVCREEHLERRLLRIPREKCIEVMGSFQKDMHFKTDQEPAMLAFHVRIQLARKSITTPTNSPKGDHQANGRAEKGLQAFQNMARRMRLAIKSHLGV